MTTATQTAEEKNEEFKNILMKKEKNIKNKAESQIRKGHYNAEKYHNTQKTTETLFTLYYVVVNLFLQGSSFRGAYKKQGAMTTIIYSIVTLLLPFVFYYYAVDLLLYIFDMFANTITSMSVTTLITIFMTVIISLVIIGSILSSPIVATITPIILGVSGFMVVMGILLRSSFMA